jgi:small subunit ribosomal protein S16
VSVKIKLKRLGKIRAPYYRIVVADARTKRDGRAIEEIGKYHPKAEPSFIEVKSDRAQHWLSVGAQPTDPVRKILEITGDWQRFKGLPGAEGTLKTAPPKEDRKEIFAAAVKETLGDAAPKGRGKSAGSGRDSDSGADKGGRAAAKDGPQSKADRPARAKDKAKSGEAKDAAADADAAAAKASQADDGKAGDGKAGDGKAKAGQAEDAKAGDSKAKAGQAKASKAEDPKAEDAKAEDAKAEDAKAEDAKAESDSAAVVADADSASRD